MDTAHQFRLFDKKSLFLSLMTILIGLFLFSSCDCKGGSESIKEEESNPGLYLTIDNNDFTASAVCRDEAYEPCNSVNLHEFSWYDDFYNKYECNPNNSSDPVASGVFILDHPNPGGDGWLACNLPPPPGGDALLNTPKNKEEYKNYITRVSLEEAPPACIESQTALSDYCVKAVNNDTVRIVYSKFCLLDRSKRPGCPTTPDDSNTFDFLLAHYTCAINEFNDDPSKDDAKEIDISLCDKMNGEVPDCFTLIHGDDEIFTTIIRIEGNADCVIRLTYNHEDALEDVFFNKSSNL